MGLICQSNFRRHLGGGHTAAQQLFGPLQTDRHQHLVWGDVILRFKAPLEMIRTEGGDGGQLVKRDGLSEVIVEVVLHLVKALQGLRF